MGLIIWVVLILVLGNIRLILHQTTPEGRRRAVRICLITDIGFVIISGITIWGGK